MKLVREKLSPSEIADKKTQTEWEKSSIAFADDILFLFWSEMLFPAAAGKVDAAEGGGAEGEGD